ncbi:MAG TPA: hypothetical protein GX521_03640 [Firmicutes bacterium]|nr:hypothetical protein [Bacillota bacterium]
MQNMWITVDRALLSEILSLYRIGRPVQGYSLITNLQYTEGDRITPRIKIIAKVDVGGGESLIIKLVKEREHPAARPCGEVGFLCLSGSLIPPAGSV